MEAGRRTSRRRQPQDKNVDTSLEENGRSPEAQQKAKRPCSADDGISTAEHVRSLSTREKRQRRWGEFEFSEGEETYDDINDPQYFPGSDSDSDDDYTKVLAKSKLASPKKPLRGNSGTQSDSSVQSTTDAGRRGSGGRGLSICFLCQKEFLKIDAHLRTHIGEDADVAEAFRAPVGSRQRKELLDKLRDRGDSLRSGEVLKAPSPEKPGAECTEEKQQHGTNGVLAVLGHVHEDVAHALSSDFSLELFSKSLYSLHGHNPAKHDFIRQKILELGQFLLTMRKSSPALTLLDAVKPGYFINMVKVVKEMTGFDAAQEIPSLALRIGQSLFEVSDIVQCQALLVGDQDLVDSMTEFKKLYQAKWPEYISQSALSDVVDLTDGSPTEPDPGGLAAQLDQGAESATVAGQNSSSPDQTTNQPTKLPPAEDLGKLHSHLDLKAQSAAAALKEQPIAEDYSSLARATLSKMALLNRGPVGELSKMKVRSFLERECLNKLEEVGLTEYEQKLCCYFQRVGVKGGDGRDVAVLLTPPLVNAIDLMIGKRQECGVPEENDYLFAVPKCRTYYRGHQSLGLFAAECGAEKPDYLRSAKLRKQVATASRIVSFRDHELDQLSSFLGQEVTPQRRFCWLPESTEQSARISKLLLALEKGKLREVQGKSLNDFGDSTEDDEDEEEESEEEKSPAGDVTIVEADSQETIKTGERNRKWTETEVGAVMRYFSSHIENGYSAALWQCEECKKSQHPALESRTLKNIQDYVRNRAAAFKHQQT